MAALGVLVIASACGTRSQPAAPPAPVTGSSTATPLPAPTTVSQFAPKWMTVVTPESWRESERRITKDFQQFGLRPTGENELPRRCNGCGVEPPTAVLTAYAPGIFDAAQARAGERVTVDGNIDGFFRASAGDEDAVLAWQYADNAWATVRGRTSTTSDPDRMIELARALRPDDFTDIRVPLSIPHLPAPMPLAEINVDHGRYGTTLDFAACGRTDTGRTPDCAGEVDSLRVQIWPADGYHGHIDDENAVPMPIGGRTGIYESSGKGAAVQVRPGMLVVFELSGPFGRPSAKPDASLKDILATVEFAPDPAVEQTWAPVSDWVRVN